MGNSLRNDIANAGRIILLCLVVAGCSHREKIKNTKMEDVAGNEDVMKFMKSFEGRGALSDSSQSVPAEKAVSAFHIAGDIAIDLVLCEPAITQPLFMNFDQRGRLWVVQYNQYPYPSGLKVMSMDQHLRSKYNKEPDPPPGGEKGADVITIFEDTDGDGTFEKSSDVIKGLNIATSVACGRGQIWVLSPPYLLAYPDPDNDGIPNGSPVVILKGFGIEDTHSVANSLRWGPDGWLYGAQGSTCTGNISSPASKNVRCNGQVIWRYHPQTHIFEIFAEGGGNTFDVEIDEKGRIYSGDNGESHGQYYKQGAYFPRDLGKHGGYTNPYTFGHLENMINKGGDIVRFTHAFIKYEGGSLPARYEGHMISVNPLQGFVQLSTLEPNRSTFFTDDEERIMQTDDRWFRPVDVTSGPDGGVYIADWYDSRLSHADPRDSWSKNTGRIYRLRDKASKEIFPAFDLSKYSNDQLMKLLSNKNIWFRQTAIRLFGDRKDPSVIPKLMKLFQGQNGQIALEAFWAINLSDGFNDNVAEMGLHHSDPYVRMWAVRLLGDANKVSPKIAAQLELLASSEPNPEVRSQLAATLKRLSASQAIPIIKSLLKNQVDSADPDIPLQLWWALESKAESDRKEVLAMFEDKAIWGWPIVSKSILSRLMQRYIMAGGHENFAACAHLLNLAPSDAQAGSLINGLQEGLRGRELIQLPPDLVEALKPYQRLFREESLALALRQGQKQALDKALVIIANKDAKLGERLSYIKILGEVNQPKAVPVLLEIMRNNESNSPAIQQAALLALQRYDQDDIGAIVVKAYPSRLRGDLDVRAAALALCATRPAWAIQLLNAIGREKRSGEAFVARTIDKDDIPEQIVKQLKLLNDGAVVKMTDRLWPDLVNLATSPEKNAMIARVTKVMKTGKGDLVIGHQIFISKCAPCHHLFDEGGIMGPDLTGYDRRNLNDLLTNIVDPSGYIREGYVSYHIITVDGRTIVGTIKSKSGNSVTIQPYSGDPVTLSTNQVKDMQPQKTSIMPERLLEGMTEQEIRDLVSYIMKPNP